MAAQPTAEQPRRPSSWDLARVLACPRWDGAGTVTVVMRSRPAMAQGSGVGTHTSPCLDSLPPRLSPAQRLCPVTPGRGLCMHLGAQAQDSDSPCSLPLHSPSVPGCVCPLSRAYPPCVLPVCSTTTWLSHEGPHPTPQASQGAGVHASAALTSWEFRGRRQDVGSSLPAGAEIPRTLRAGTEAGASGTLQSLEGPASPCPLGPCGVCVGMCPGPPWPASEWSVFWVALCPTSSAAVEKQMRGAVSSLPMGPAPHAGPLLRASHVSPESRLSWAPLLAAFLILGFKVTMACCWRPSPARTPRVSTRSSVWRRAGWRTPGCGSQQPAHALGWEVSSIGRLLCVP
ncbi:unnamed protein product [Nyctereutes procyonoides]|uniref:(raccoon dog) hypothetical protein n=1 Tax=Nyctereutes procyonoides TaxID=34880 RepID=A0A811YKF9_NYCPR|nr:unnamed protein product [Nyctereutes procyonoides]